MLWGRPGHTARAERRLGCDGRSGKKPGTGGLVVTLSLVASWWGVLGGCVPAFYVSVLAHVGTERGAKAEAGRS